MIPTAGNPLLLLIEMVVLMAILSWIALSAIQAGQRMAAVERCRRKLARDRTEMTLAIESLQRDQRKIESELHRIEQSLEVRQAEAADLQAQLNRLKLDGPREYRLLNERFGDGDRLWLLTVPRDGRPEGWAVAAADSGSALALLAKSIAAPHLQSDVQTAVRVRPWAYPWMRRARAGPARGGRRHG